MLIENFLSLIYKEKKTILYCETTGQDTARASNPLLFLRKMYRTPCILPHWVSCCATHTSTAQKNEPHTHQAREVTVQADGTPGNSPTGWEWRGSTRAHQKATTFPELGNEAHQRCKRGANPGLLSRSHSCWGRRGATYARRTSLPHAACPHPPPRWEASTWKRN